MLRIDITRTGRFTYTLTLCDPTTTYVTRKVRGTHTRALRIAHNWLRKETNDEWHLQLT